MTTTQSAVPRTVDAADLPGAPPTADRVLTAFAIALPATAVVAAAVTWSRTVGWGELVAAVVLFLVVQLAANIGLHRLFSHHAFMPSRGLKIGLAVTASLALQGSPTVWVATHRLHHARSDQPGDPHSPHAHSDPAKTLSGGKLRRILHAHAGWLFATATPDPDRWAPDMVEDRDLAFIHRWYPPFAIASLLAPFPIGALIGGSASSGLWALVWVSGVRVFCVYHTTWSVNSLCHMFGRRPFRSGDRSTNFAPLVLVSMGECWHNNHHAYPNLARHGIGPRELDITAGVIRLFERVGWATKVRWPSEKILAEARARR